MSESRQRWRLIFRRDEPAMYLSHLDAIHAWERGLRRGRIPVAMSEGFNPRPKLAFAAPLQLGMLAEHELADLFLAERLTAPDLRDRLAGCLPPGYVVTDLHDVWVGASAIAPQLAAADYRTIVTGLDAERLEKGATELLLADTLLRERKREKSTVRYDLRPLLIGLRCGPIEASETSIALEPSAAQETSTAPAPATIPAPAPAPAAAPFVRSPAARLWMRLRHSQEGGTGRMEEVVAALAEQLGLRFAWSGPDDAAEAPAEAPAEASPGATAAGDSGAAHATDEIDVFMPVRERLWLAGELAASSSGNAATV